MTHCRKHKDTKAQRHKEGAHQEVLPARLLCVSVPLCLCFFTRHRICENLHLAGELSYLNSLRNSNVNLGNLGNRPRIMEERNEAGTRT